jgi:hypothetical protein
MRIIGIGDALTNKLITPSGVVTLAHSYEIQANRIGFALTFLIERDLSDNNLARVAIRDKEN